MGATCLSLRPDRLLQEEIESFIDRRKWRTAQKKEKASRAVLDRLARSLQR
jgi:hypothetical protein